MTVESVEEISKLQKLTAPPEMIARREVALENVRKLNSIPTYALDDEVIEQAIKLRQQKKMKLGDAIIAATAVAYNIPQITQNVADPTDSSREVSKRDGSGTARVQVGWTAGGLGRLPDEMRRGASRGALEISSRNSDWRPVSFPLKPVSDESHLSRG